ncbi:MAG: hypothetical protein ACSLFH_07855 [Desulfuromonadales bacterium]
MKKIITTTLTIFLLLFVNNAMAESGNRGNRDGYASQGKRIEQHLDAKGNRIERHFDRKADKAYAQGKNRQGRHFQKKGEQINRHMDRKGERIHTRFEHRDSYRNKQQRRHDNRYQKQSHIHAYPRVAYPVSTYRSYDSSLSVMVQQPGLLLGWNIYR